MNEGMMKAHLWEQFCGNIRMHGTFKQVRWANKIRSKICAELVETSLPLEVFDWVCGINIATDWIALNDDSDISKVVAHITDWYEAAGEEESECPFCGGMPYREFQMDESDRDIAPGDWRVLCDTCGTAGPAGSDHADAIRNWNRRYV